MIQNLKFTKIAPKSRITEKRDGESFSNFAINFSIWCWTSWYDLNKEMRAPANYLKCIVKWVPSDLTGKKKIHVEDWTSETVMDLYKCYFHVLSNECLLCLCKNGLSTKILHRYIRQMVNIRRQCILPEMFCYEDKVALVAKHFY